MQDQPPAEPIIDGNDAVSIIFEAFANALVDWWYLWLLMLAVGIALALLNNWARRVEARARARQHEEQRIERAEGRAGRPRT